MQRRTVIHLGVLGLLSLVLFFFGLGERSLWNPNEPIYGEAVREMAESGSWSVPTVNGQDFAEKPILYYWLALAAARVGGSVNELTLRLPSAVVASMGLYFAFVAFLPRLGRRQALVVAACLGIQYSYWWGGRSAQMDTLLTVATMATVVLLLQALEKGSRAWWAAAGIAAGIGFLAKGPVAWVLPALIVGLFWLVDSARKRPRPLHLAIAAGAAVLVAAPWYLVLLARGEHGFLHETLIRQNFSRYLEPWHHHRPWWYFLAHFWAELAPSSWLIPVAVGLRGRTIGERRLMLLSWCWIAVVLVFFSLSEGKRAPYLMPAAPAVAMLASTVLDRLATRTLSRGRTMAVAILAGLLTVGVAGAGISLLFRPSWIDGISGTQPLALLLAVTGTVAAISIWLARHQATPLVVTGILAIVGVYTSAVAAGQKVADEVKSAKPFAVEIKSRLNDGAAVASYGMWEWRAEYSYYADTVIEPVSTEVELLHFWGQPGERYVVVESASLEGILDALPGAVVVEQARVGSRRAFLLTAGDEQAAVRP